MLIRSADGNELAREKVAEKGVVEVMAGAGVKEAVVRGEMVRHQASCTATMWMIYVSRSTVVMWRMW